MSEPQYTDSRLLLELTDPNAPTARMWSEDELCDLLQHQLSASLVVDLEHLGQLQMLAAAQLGEGARPPIRSFRDLFQHESPPIELLRLVKTFAQKLLRSPDPTLPRQIALLLYDAAILSARVHYQQRITRIPDDTLRQSAMELLSSPWMDEALGKLLSRGIEQIRPSPGKSPEKLK